MRGFCFLCFFPFVLFTFAMLRNTNERKRSYDISAQIIFFFFYLSKNIFLMFISFSIAYDLPCFNAYQFQERIEMHIYHLLYDSGEFKRSIASRNTGNSIAAQPNAHRHWLIFWNENIRDHSTHSFSNDVIFRFRDLFTIFKWLYVSFTGLLRLFHHTFHFLFFYSLCCWWKIPLLIINKCEMFLMSAESELQVFNGHGWTSIKPLKEFSSSLFSFFRVVQINMIFGKIVTTNQTALTQFAELLCIQCYHFVYFFSFIFYSDSFLINWTYPHPTITRETHIQSVWKSHTSLPHSFTCILSKLPSLPSTQQKEQRIFGCFLENNLRILSFGMELLRLASYALTRMLLLNGLRPRQKTISKQKVHKRVNLKVFKKNFVSFETSFKKFLV